MVLRVRDSLRKAGGTSKEEGRAREGAKGKTRKWEAHSGVVVDVTPPEIPVDACPKEPLSLFVSLCLIELENWA